MAEAEPAPVASGPKRRRGGRGGKGGGGGGGGDPGGGAAEGSQPESANPPAAEGGERAQAKPKGDKGKGVNDSSDALYPVPLAPRRPHPPAAFHDLAEEQVRSPLALHASVLGSVDVYDARRVHRSGMRAIGLACGFGIAGDRSHEHGGVRLRPV
jgi:hypothetical protein